MSLPSDYYKEAVNKFFTPAPAPSITAPMTTTVGQSLPTGGATEQAKEPDKDKQSNVGKLFGGIGSVLSAAGDVLDLSGKYAARPILGAGSKLVASDAVQGTLDKIGVESLTEDEAKRIQEADSYTEAWREREKTVEWWESIAAEVIADPTTWITAGTVAAISKLPKVAAAAKHSPKLAEALIKAENAAGIFERAQALPLTAPVAGAKRLAGWQGDLANKTARAMGKRDILDPITGEAISRGLLDQSPKSVLRGRISEVDDALRTTLNRGASTRLSGDAGEYGFSSVDRTASLAGSNVAHDARRTLDRLRGPGGVGPPNYQFVRGELNNLSKPELADLYINTDVSDPLFPHIESVMTTKGLITHTTVKGTPKGFKGATITHLNQSAIDRSRIAQERIANTPGGYRASPKVTGNLEADYDNTMRFVRQKAGLPLDTPTATEPFVKNNVMKMLKHNAGRVDAPTLFAHPEVQADLISAVTATSEREAARHLGLAFHRINAKQSARGVMHPWGARIVDKYVPQIGKTVDDIQLPAINQYAVHNAVVDDTQMNALGKMFEDQNVINKQKMWEKDGDKAQEIFERTPGISNKFGDSTTVQDIENAYHLMSPADKQWIDAYRKRWKIRPEDFEGSQSLGNRISKVASTRDVNTFTMGDAWVDNITETWAQQASKNMGIENAKVSGELLGKLGWVPRAWREQALISPRYQLMNAMDMSIKSALHGVNMIENRGAAKTAKELGTELPRSIFVGATPLDLAGVGKMLGGFEEFNSSAATSSLPGPFGAISKLNRGVSRGMENSFREWAWDNAVKDTLHAHKPRLHQSIRNMLIDVNVGTNPRAEALIKDLEGKGTFVTAQGKKINIKRDAGILFSPDDLNALARKHGATQSQANALAREWQGAIQQGSANGIEMSNKVHFDFDKTYNIEDKLFLKTIMPFHFFATRNIPGYAQLLANRPELVNAWMAYQDVSEQDRIEMGLPDRFEGMVSIGDGFLDGLLGPNKVFFNPMAAVSFVDQAKGVGQATKENEFNEPAKFLSRRGVGELIDRTGKLGVGGPAPWIQIPLSIIGVTSDGAKDETMPLLRHTGLLETTTGMDVENVPRQFFNELRSMFHNGERVETHTGSQFRDSQIVTKLQETMQALIERGDDPVEVRNFYETAAKDGPGNSEWDKAAEQVRKEQFGRDLRGFWFPFPTKDTTEMGVELHQARESMPEGTLDNKDVVEMLKHFGHPAVANRGFRKNQHVDRQGDPIWINSETGKQETEAEKAAKKDMWGGDNWGPAREYPYNSKVIYNMWQQYKSSLAEPDKARVSDFFKAARIPGR